MKSSENLSWLPDKRYYEYAYHKFFNPEISYDQWQPWDEWTYPDRDILRFTHIIKNQLAHIQDKKVLDVACHLGYLSLFCLHNGAKFVTATNIRQRELDIAKEVIGYTNFQNYDFILSDLNDHQSFENLCQDHDTVIFSGIIYHLRNHYQQLELIYNSPVRTLIIEGWQPDKDDCCVYWHHEDAEDATNAYAPDKHKVFVGVPTQSWVQSALIDIGWSIVYNQRISYVKPNNQTTNRYIITAQKG